MTRVAWTTAERALAESDLTDGQVAEQTGRALSAVARYRRRTLGRGTRTRSPKHAWTPEEDAAVLDLTRTTAETAQALGLSAAQVKGRRQRLRRGTVNHQPTRLAVPQGHPEWLLAKTCPACGRFLPREAFRPRGRGSANTSCRDCETRVYLASLTARQRESLQQAQRWGQEWTDRDLAIALRTDLSVQQRARTLQRTAFSVTAAIRRFGGRDRPPGPAHHAGAAAVKALEQQPNGQ